MIGQAIGEMLFDLAYFITALTVGIILIVKSKTIYLRLFGIMAVVLATGDSFHLVPRVISLFTNKMAENAFYLGLGQMITSITMTIFYVILYFIWELRANKKSLSLRITMIGLAIVRIVLCCLPQNKWFEVNAPVSWGIYRNIPFAIMGIIIIVLCFMQWKQHDDKDYLQMAIAVILSFGFYIPVVVAVHLVPALGSLMIPKTLAYVWVVMIGYMEYRRKMKKVENTPSSKDTITETAKNEKEVSEDIVTSENVGKEDVVEN